MDSRLVLYFELVKKSDFSGLSTSFSVTFEKRLIPNGKA